MRARPVALPTFTVGTILAMRRPHANSVSSRKLLCSEYGTAKHAASRELPRWGARSAAEKDERQCGDVRIVLMDGLASTDLGWVRLVGGWWRVESGGWRRRDEVNGIGPGMGIE